MPMSQLFQSGDKQLQAELADAQRTIDVLRKKEEMFRRILANMPDVTCTPSVARNLLSNIPRLDGIAWIVGQQRFGAATPDAQVLHT